MQLKLDNNGDLDFSSGNLELISGADEIAQKLACRFKFYKGEYYLDTRLGVPYFTIIFEKTTPLNVVTQILHRVASACPGVMSIDSFKATKAGSTRGLAVEFKATVTDGTTIDFSQELMP